MIEEQDVKHIIQILVDANRALVRELITDELVYGVSYCRFIDGVATRIDPTKIILKEKNDED